MKNATPKRVTIISTIIVSLIIFAFLISFKIIRPDFLSWWVVFTVPCVVLITGATVFHYTMENFVYRKIKLIYKIIYDTRNIPEKKPPLPKVKRDIIDRAESEVIEWKNKSARESKKQRKLEVYRKEFLGNVFHELKTPIFNMQGYLESLIDGGLRDEKINLRFLNKARKNVDRMAEIVDDLQMISNLEDGSFALTETKFDIYKLVLDSLDNMDILATKKNIRLGVKDGCAKSFLVYADRDLIFIVLNNLLTNSIKYGKQDGKTRVGLYDMDDYVLVEVSDNGIGIDNNQLPRIFERFFRVDKGRSRDMGGTGLGLSIVKHIIEVHNQTINVRSAPDLGTTFGFTLKKV